MKTAQAPVVDGSSHRRSQPVRQTRTNPPRSSANVGRSGARDQAGNAPMGDQPIDIFPAITHFADAITALPKELVRHFTLLKEVDAKIFAPEEQLFRLVAAASQTPLPESRPFHDASSSGALASTPMSAQGSSNGLALSTNVQTNSAIDDTHSASVFDPSNLPRRHLFRQTAVKIQEMLVSLEEKNHVISTANEALQAQLTRIEDVWPYLENEFSDEAKWGSTTHWAYPENRTGRSSHAERTRRDGAAVISTAAQALVEEAAARSDARKQAVQARRNQRNNHQDSDFDDHDNRHKNEGSKKTQGKSRKAADNTNVGLGISTSIATSNGGNPPQKRRKVEKPANGAAPAERALSTVFGGTVPKAKTTSPRETPAPEGPKKRKALPTGSGQSKKSRNGVTPSAASSPVLADLPDPKVPARASPAPNNVPRPTTARARQNSIQSLNAENGKTRTPSSVTNKPNGNVSRTPDLGAAQGAWPRLGQEPPPARDLAAPIKTEPGKKDVDQTDSTSTSTTGNGKRENKPDEERRKSESLPPSGQNVAITTKSGRASKPSTPSMATFHEAPRSRSSRNTEGNGGGKKNQKKGNTAAQTMPSHAADEDTTGNMQGDDGDGDIDADEPTYCYCNGVSYGEMVACDADDCPREWFHMECVGLRSALLKAKWYCEDCKERLKINGKKVNGRQ